jgi:hypothetical protein
MTSERMTDVTQQNGDTAMVKIRSPTMSLIMVVPQGQNILVTTIRASDRGRIGVFYAFKMPKTHWG